MVVRSSCCFSALLWSLGLALRAQECVAQQDAVSEGRELLLLQAQEAHTRGDHATALRLGEQAERARQTPSLSYFLARELHELSRNAEAFARARACLRAAERDAQLRNREQILGECRTLSTRVYGLIGSVQLSLPQQRPAGLRVVVAGIVREEAEHTLPIPVDPGDVSIEVSAPGLRSVQRTVHVSVGQHANETIALERVEGTSRSAAPLVLIASGATLTAAGTAMMIAGFATQVPAGCRPAGTVSQYDLLCRDSMAVDAAVTSDWVLTLAPVVGGVGLGVLTAGLVLQLLPARSSEERSVFVAPTLTGVRVGGAF